MLDTRKASETMAVGEDEKASLIWTGTGLREEVGIGRLSLRKVNSWEQANFYNNPTLAVSDSSDQTLDTGEARLQCYLWLRQK